MFNNKKKSHIGVLKAFIPYLKENKKLALSALFSLFLVSIATLMLPVLVRFFVDHGIGKDNRTNIIFYFVFIVINAILLGIASGWRYASMNWLSEQIIISLRKKLYRKMLNQTPHFYEQCQVGEILSRMIGDTTLVRILFTSSLSLAIRNIFLLIGSLILMVTISTKLFYIIIIVTLGIVIPLLILGRYVKRFSLKTQDEVAQVSNIIHETLDQIKTVQAYCAQEKEYDSLAQKLQEALFLAKKHIMIRGVLVFFAFSLGIGGMAVSLLMGGQLVVHNEITGGMLLQFVLCAFIAAASLTALSEIWGNVQVASGATERIMSFLSSEEEEGEKEVEVGTQQKNMSPDSADPAKKIDSIDEIEIETTPVTPDQNSIIEFCNVSFAYPSRPHEEVLHDVSFTISVHTIACLVGLSGAGKSTIFQILLGFYKPSKGTIFVQGRKIDSFSLNELRACFSFVQQETSLFNRTCLENICYGIDKSNFPSMTRVEEVMKQVNMHDFIVALPLGYKTIMGGKGTLLSAGQRQRLLIARALLRGSPILLLDEVTSALDPHNEQIIGSILESIREKITIFVIAHRLNTIKKADHVIVVSSGKIEAQDTHSQLINTSIVYRQCIAEDEKVQQKE